MRPAATSSAISRSRAVRPPSSWLGERGARRPEGAQLAGGDAAPALGAGAFQAGGGVGERGACGGAVAERGEGLALDEAGAGGGERGGGDLRLGRPLRRAGGVARREQRLRFAPGRSRRGRRALLRARRCGSLPRLHEVGVGGGALAGRKGREALAADRGPDRLRALGRWPLATSALPRAQPGWPLAWKSGL